MNLNLNNGFRVVFESRENYRLVDGKGNILAGEISGAYRNSGGSWPVVGDWVSGRRLPGDNGDWILIEELRPRKSVIKRKDANGRSSKNQILASNVDVIFIVTSANDDFNMNRVERYLSLVAAEKIRPVILLNKTDLQTAADSKLAELKNRFRQIPVLAVSARENRLEGIWDYLPNGTTVTFVGSSGVGKSSLINAVLGREYMDTGSIREEDRKGRHTTTHRELIYTETGVAIIDTPGLRSVGLTEDSEAGAWFSDVEDMFSQCKFGDCTHQAEPGCAVQSGLESGALDPERWQNYLQMQKEIRFEQRKANKALQSEEKKKWAKRSMSVKRIKKARGFL